MEVSIDLDFSRLFGELEMKYDKVASNAPWYSRGHFSIFRCRSKLKKLLVGGPPPILRTSALRAPVETPPVGRLRVLRTL